MIKDIIRPTRLDWLGAVLSMSCAIHCLILPIVISLGPLASLGDGLHEVTEICFLVLTLGVGLWSFRTTYPIHKKPGPLILLCISLLLIVIARFSHGMLAESTLSILGALLIAFAHIMNHKFMRKTVC